jgi:MFS family permease
VARPLIWLLAIGAGIGVANVYYIQPVLPLVQESFGSGPEQASLVPALTQVGYAAGMLFLAPLGDLLDRKRLIVAKAIILRVCPRSHARANLRRRIMTEAA